MGWTRHGICSPFSHVGHQKMIWQFDILLQSWGKATWSLEYFLWLYHDRMAASNTLDSWEPQHEFCWLFLSSKIIKRWVQAKLPRCISWSMPLAKGFVPPSRMELVPWSMPMARVQAQTKLQFGSENFGLLPIPNSNLKLLLNFNLLQWWLLQKTQWQSCQYHRNKTSLDTSGFSYEGQWQYGQQLKWHKNHYKTLLVSSFVSRCSSGQGPMGHLQGATHSLSKTSYFLRLESTFTSIFIQHVQYCFFTTYFCST